MSKSKDWVNSESYKEFAEVLRMPIVQRAFDVVREAAQSDSVVLTQIAGSSNAADGVFRIALMQASQAGMIEALKKLEVLGRVQVKRELPEVKAPYEDVQADYLENRQREPFQQPTT